MDIIFLFYEGMTALDVIGPHEILCRLPKAQVKRVSRTAGPIATDSCGLVLHAEYSLAEVSQADILLIPGAGSATSLSQYPEVHDWIRLLHQTTQWTTSVCTGSLILGKAGILTGLRATSHWAALDRLERWGANPTSQRVVEEGKVMTAAGVSAGIDMALLLTAKVAGNSVAQALQLALEYDPQPPFDGGSYEKADSLLREALKARMISKFETLSS